MDLSPTSSSQSPESHRCCRCRWAGQWMS